MKQRHIFLSLIEDFILLVLVVLAVLNLRIDIVPFKLATDTGLFFITSIIILCLSCYIFRIYHRIWQYASITDFLNIILAITTGTALIIFLNTVFIQSVSSELIAFLWIFSIGILGGRRFISRLVWHFSHKINHSKNHKKTLIIGAGEAGALIVRTLQSSKTDVNVEPIGFIDDDIKKRGLHLYGLPILGDRKDIPKIAKKYGIKEAIIAIPTATTEQIKTIGDYCHQANIKVKVLPSVLDLIQGKQLLGQARELKMEDLLQRREVEANINLVAGYLNDRVVLVTGAGGSIGSELCRQICRFNPKTLILLGRGENSIHEIYRELTHDYPNSDIFPVIADIKDQTKIEETFKRYRPMVVFHAAAHKHVDLMELHPDEAFKNNVFGTLNVAKMAHRYNSGIFVLISTDKAVNPSSVMGLTKHIAEMIVQHYSLFSKNKFVAVRFGNVLGSRGSVIHLFRKQIATGGPVTVTHPEMRRYFMTIREAAQLVIQAGSFAKGHEIFMLDMGEQVKIVDLVKDMIQLSGLCPGKDIEIKFVGSRPGEKLSEELLTDKEKALVTQHPKIFVVVTEPINSEIIDFILSIKGTPCSKEINYLQELAFSKHNLNRNKNEISIESGGFFND